MKQLDWAKIYAAMDKRVTLKYQHLPSGEQVGKLQQLPPPAAKSV